MQLKETKAAAKELLSELPIKKPRKLKRSDISLLILSFISALFLWVYIASTIITDVKYEFKVPLKADLTGTKAESYRLNLLPESEQKIAEMTVVCTITGTRAAIGGLKEKDVEAYIDFDSDVTNTIGVQMLPVKVRTTNGAQFDSATPSVSYVSVNMDRYETKQVPVKDVIHPNLKIDSETIIRDDEIVVSPTYAEILGPSTQLANIDHIRVNINTEEELTQTKTYTDWTDFSLIDQNGNELDDSAFQNLTNSRFTVQIPVCYSRTLPIGINITGKPDDFAEETILKRIRLIGSSNKEYVLPGYGDDTMPITLETTDLTNKEQLDNRTSYNLEGIPLSDLVPGKSIDVAIPIAAGFEYPDKITSVKVKLDDTDLTTKTFWIKNSEIELQNKDDRYNYELKSPEGNTQVMLCGTEEELSRIDAEDLKAYVNLISTTITKEGEYTPVITVTLPKTAEGVWFAKSPQSKQLPTLSMNITVAN